MRWPATSLASRSRRGSWRYCHYRGDARAALSGEMHPRGPQDISGDLHLATVLGEFLVNVQ
jgi:hypothetical protein